MCFPGFHIPSGTIPARSASVIFSSQHYSFGNDASRRAGRRTG
jgi:hypothetical protein